MRKRFLPTLLFLLFIAMPTFAQLRVTLNVSSRPDPYLSNWSQRKEIVIVTVVNSGAAAVRAKFDCKINKDGSLIVNTKPDKMKILDIPTGVSQYYGEDLVPLEAAKIKEGVDKTAVQTGMLPAGSYEFCCALLDPQDKQITPPVCKSFTIQSYQAPVLLLPEDKSIVGKGNRPMFRWTAVSPKPNFPVTYQLRVFEVLKGQTPIIAFRVNKPILERNDIPVTQLLWPADVELPNIRLQYIWTVRALDEKGNPIGEPDGYATPFIIEPCCHNPPEPRDCCPPDDITDNGGGGVNAKQSGDSTKTGGGTTLPSVPTTSGGTIPRPKIVEKDNDVDGQGSTSNSEATPTKNIFSSGRNSYNPSNCPTLLAPNAGANITKESELQFRWSFENQRVAKQPSFLVIEMVNAKNPRQSEILLKAEVTGKLSYTPEKSVVQRILKSNGEYKWTIQNSTGTTCMTMSFKTGCTASLEIINLKKECSTGNKIRVCLQFKFSDSQGRPLKFTQPAINVPGYYVMPSGFFAWIAPLPASGVPVFLPTSNFTDGAGTPISVATLSIPSGTTYTICFEIDPLSASKISVGIQGDNLNTNGPGNCRQEASDEFTNPCICNKCDSTNIKIVLPPGKAIVDPKTGQLGIAQDISVSPDQLLSMKSEITYLHWEPTNKKCIPCNKNPKEWGTLLEAKFKGQEGITTQNRTHWKFESPSNTTSGKADFTIGLPLMLDCCKLKGYVCIRYKFFMQPGDTPSECYECERVVCYSF